MKNPLRFCLALVLGLSACSPTLAPPEPVIAQPEKALEENSNPIPETLTQIPDEEATRLMYELVNSDSQQAVDTIVAAKDTRFIAVFIELLRINQMSFFKNTGYKAPLEALEALSGQPIGYDWFAWVEWYGGTDLIPPPGFTGWKGKLLSQIDVEFGNFLRDDFPSTIRTEEIVWGGVVVDGIPALNNATMIPADQANYLRDDEPVFGISINGDNRAYPLRILDWHEMANDVVGGVPVSLAYCTLCGAGVAYDGRASNGEIYDFGSSGFLFRSNKLMYDHQTRTLWNQLTGEPVLGELAGTGVKLELLPVVVSSWEDWLAQHPDTLVLDLDTGYQRPYTPGSAYGHYFIDEDTMFPVWQRSNLLPNKDRIYALEIEDIPKAYPVEILAEEQVINDTIGQTDLVLIASRGEVTVSGESQYAGEVFYNAGGEVRAYARIDNETFSTAPQLDTVLDTKGRTWQITEEALIGPEGELAPRINGHLAYWFGWYSFFPQTLLYEQP
ncbi:MAG: DUF3179 domain-containing protein, partial [Anaerolineae bacterium]|jgi:hypothetical protein|nr:DUF3179 domain-containing protein [Anaerolineae bacterium]MBT7188960.1 DUF3179 domain-containing protein [Anaerolineae bacterium]MBT7991440.1 DUF3179 domain-containing protein [Anaerolineae bacterium]